MNFYKQTYDITGAGYLRTAILREKHIVAEGASKMKWFFYHVLL